MEQGKLTKVLNRLYIGGKISKGEYEEIIKEVQSKEADFEEKVNKAIQEVMDDGYVKKTFERISKEKKR